jgi:hypothetical protein
MLLLLLLLLHKSKLKVAAILPNIDQVLTSS